MEHTWKLYWCTVLTSINLFTSTTGSHTAVHVWLACILIAIGLMGLFGSYHSHPHHIYSNASWKVYKNVQTCAIGIDIFPTSSLIFSAGLSCPLITALASVCNMNRHYEKLLPLRWVWVRDATECCDQWTLFSDSTGLNYCWNVCSLTQAI